MDKMASSFQVNEWALADHFPLHHFCKEGNVERVVNLLENDRTLAAVEDTYFGWTPAHWAAFFGKLDCLRCVVSVLANGVNIQTSKLCLTPAHTAAEGGCSQCLLWLLQAGANVNTKDFAGETPLHKSARVGSAECVSLLIASSCDIRIINNAGETAGILAERHGHPTVAAYIHHAELVRELGGNGFHQHSLSNGQVCRKRTFDSMNYNGFTKRMRSETSANEMVHTNFPMLNMNATLTALPPITSSVVEHEKLCRMERGYVNSLFENVINQFHGC